MKAPLDRARLRPEVAALLSRFRSVLLVGPHQVGKTTLARTDREAQPARFLLLGSAAMAWLRQGSESLAGRLAVVELKGRGLQPPGRQSLPAAAIGRMESPP